MRALFLIASVIISSSTVSGADQIADSAPASSTGVPLVHVQPQSGGFYPHSPANQTEQQSLLKSDGRQEKSDEALDKKLSICRC